MPIFLEQFHGNDYDDDDDDDDDDGGGGDNDNDNVHYHNCYISEVSISRFIISYPSYSLSDVIHYYIMSISTMLTSYTIYHIPYQHQ